MSFTEHFTQTKAHAVMTGVFGVLVVLATGAAIAFATGMITPPSASALVTTPPCCITTPPPTTVTPPPPVVILPPIVETTGPCCETTPPPTTPIPPPPPPIAPPVVETTEPCCETVPPPPPVVPPVVPPIVVPPIVPPPPVPAECVLLTATPTQFRLGDAVTLAWQTRNATSITIDQGVGSVTPVAAGSVVVHPTGNTTYRATVTGATGSVHCQASVVVTVTPPAPACVQLTASDTKIEKGDSVVLSWVTSNASSVSLNQGIGRVTPTASGSITVNPTSDTTYTATVPDAPDIAACSVRVEIEEDNNECTRNCGGGGGKRNPRVDIDLEDLEGEVLAAVYLSELPYTGLDLGPSGTLLYWTILALWSAGTAYLVIFKAMPFALRKYAVAAIAPLDAAVQHADTHTHVLESVSTHEPRGLAAIANNYSSHDGFRSFAQGGHLTIDDIVSGLARESVEAPVAASMPEPVVAPETALPPATDMSQAAAPVQEPVPQRAPTAQVELADDIPGFIAALLAGDKDTAFGTLRGISRTGGDSEQFLTHAVCALDDAYRAKMDGSEVHPQIAVLTRDCHPNFLEKLVTALSTAVDSTYSSGVTSAKLAVTRALTVVNG